MNECKKAHTWDIRGQWHQSLAHLAKSVQLCIRPGLKRLSAATAWPGKLSHAMSLCTKHFFYTERKNTVTLYSSLSHGYGYRLAVWLSVTAYTRSRGVFLLLTPDFVFSLKCPSILHSLVRSWNFSWNSRACVEGTLAVSTALIVELETQFSQLHEEGVVRGLFSSAVFVGVCKLSQVGEAN